MGDVGALVREEPRHVWVLPEVGVDQIGVFGGRRRDVEHRWPHVVGDLDRGGCSFGCCGIVRHDGCHLLTDEPHPVLGEHVAVLHVQAEGEWEVGTGGDRHDAGHRFGSRGVDGNDAGVGVRALHHGGVQEIGAELEVVDEPRGTADLVASVDARLSAPHVLPAVHDAPPLSAVDETAASAPAWSRMASTIGS